MAQPLEIPVGAAALKPSMGRVARVTTPVNAPAVTKWFATRSVQDVLDRNRGVGPGFDVLRIALAVIIFMGHVSWLTGHAKAGAMPVTGFNPVHDKGWEGWYRPILVSWVPAFFALSGFLVMGSAVRTRATQTFLAFRALRIFPALLVELTLSALLLGLLFTSLKPQDYLFNPQFLRYFGNLVGWVDFTLPGVFSHNHVPSVVNANLWTLPSEFDCYLVAGLLMLTGVLYRQWMLSALFLAVTALFIGLNSTTGFSVSPTTLAPIAITYYFFAGVMFFQWRKFIPIRWSIFVVAVAGAYLLQLSHHTVYLAPLFLTYCVIFIGMIKFPKVPIISSGDYSYGIYLYGFPITQGVLAVVPALNGNRWGTVVVAGSITLLFAAFSWHVIEKRALTLKRHLPKQWFPMAQKQSVSLPSERATLMGGLPAT